MARDKTITLIPDNDLQANQERNASELHEASSQLALIEHQAQENARQLSLQLHYEGALTVGALEDEIRFYQRRTVEACLELGKRLLILKELTPHGEFKKRIELLDIDYRMAAKFMSATVKFSKVNSSSLLKAAGSQTKMLELVLLDDEEIEALESGDSVKGLTLDAIETMSVSELKKALRDSKQTLQAKDEVIASKNTIIDSQAENMAKLEHRQRTITVDEQILSARDFVQKTAASVKATVMTELRRSIKELHEFEGDHKTIAASAIIEIMQEIKVLRDEYLLPATLSEDAAPEWMDADTLAQINGLG
jgi:hypothetical protein